MQESNFDRLLHRYLHKELTPAESVKFNAWLDLLEKENAGDLELTPEAKAKLFDRITSSISTVDEVLALYPRRKKVRKIGSSRWLQIAATILILASVTYVLRDYFPAISSYGEQAQSFKKMILQDGSIVWLQPTSKLRYYEQPGGRFAELEGEALFEISKNPASPFTILCEGINVKVLGTSFKLKTGTDKIELHVLTGKVQVTSATAGPGVAVEPNERVVFTTSGLLERRSISPTEITALVANSEYAMRFNNRTMKEVIGAVSKKFDIEITVTDPDLYKCHVTADFTDRSLVDTLTILTELLHVNFTLTSNSVELSGNGC